MTTTTEPIDRIMNVGRFKQILEQYPEEMLIFVKNDSGDYSTAIIFEVTEDYDLQVNAL
jgi:hypothetical protein